MHDCPLLIVRAFTAVVTASSRFAEGMTMNGSLPPSSRTVFLICLPAIDATLRPAGSLPVNVAATTRRIVQDSFDCVRADQQRLKRAFRKSCAREDLFDRERTLRHVRSVFQQANVSGHQRRRREAKHLPERKVPGHHGEHRTKRLKAHVTLLRIRFDDLIGEMMLRVLGVVAANPGALFRFGDRGL